MDVNDEKFGIEMMRLAKQQPGERLTFGNIDVIRSKDECAIFEHGLEKQFGIAVFVKTQDDEFPVFDFHNNETGTLLTAQTSKSIGQFLEILGEFQACMRIGQKQISLETPSSALVM